MNEYYYSASTNGFYPLSLKDDYEASKNGWPKDAIAVTDDEYNLLIDGRGKGKIIEADSKGKPVLLDPPPLSPQQLAEVINDKRNALIAEATQKTQNWQTQLMLGIITDDDKESLVLWMKYVQQLQLIDPWVSTDVSWPSKPMD